MFSRLLVSRRGSQVAGRQIGQLLQHTQATTSSSTVSAATSAMRGGILPPTPPPQGLASTLSRMLKPSAVFLAGSSAAFLAASTAANHAQKRDQDIKGSFDRWRRRRASWAQSWPEPVKGAVLWWQDMSPSQRLVTGVIGANIAVYLVWRLPSMGPLLLRHTVLALPPLAARSHTMLTSAFTHISLTHLGCNMIALHSFGTITAAVMGPQQFGAFYLAAGLASSCAAIVGRLAVRRMTGGLSIGASGAVYACFATTALMYPHERASLIFLPMFPIEMGTLLKCTVGLDVAGALLGWRLLDHFGHLGGAAFGIWYTLHGHKYWQELRQRHSSKLERQ